MPNKKFTLIELLVVISIIGILSSMLLPSLSKARAKSRAAVCVSNMKQMGTANYMYIDAWDWCAPCIWYDNTPDLRWARNDEIRNYMGWDASSRAYWMPVDMACPEAVDKTASDPNHSLIDDGNVKSISTNLNYNHFGISGQKRYRGMRLNWLPEPAMLGNIGENWNNWNVGISGIDPRHLNKTNVLFFDGHVESISRAASQASNSSPWIDSEGRNLTWYNDRNSQQ